MDIVLLGLSGIRWDAALYSVKRWFRK